MDSRELRIGNLVLTYDPEEYYDEGEWDGVEWKVAEILQFDSDMSSTYVNEGFEDIGKKYDDVERATVILNPSFIKPIPLTEEWLLKFGFKKFKNGNNSGTWIYCTHATTWFYQSMQTGKISASNFGIITDHEIKYVHQAQNLIFALTGQELEIKE